MFVFLICFYVLKQVKSVLFISNLKITLPQWANKTLTVEDCWSCEELT